MKKNLLILTLTFIVVFAACTKKASPGKTVKSTTYTTDMVPLIQAKCSPCHLPTKGGRKADFENYEGAKKYGADMLARVLLNPGDRGFMPFKHDKLAAEEIAIIKNWVDQGMQEK
jgi:mono/diheme cytochrome c family protein